MKEKLTQRWKAGVLGPSQLDLDAMKPEHRAEEEQPYDLMKREYGQHANQGEERSGPYFTQQISIDLSSVRSASVDIGMTASND